MTTQTQQPRAFVAGAVLLVISILTCGFFAGLAGQEIGDQKVMFAISFVFLGIVTILIFTLAYIDSSTKAGDHEFMAGHGH